MMSSNKKHLTIKSNKNKESNYISLFFKSYVNDLYALGLTYTSDKELIKDVIQDLFLDLLENESRISKIENIKMYLFVSFKNNLFSAIKKGNRYSDIEPGDSVIWQEPNQGNGTFPDNSFDDEDQKRKWLKKYYAKLTKSQQRIIHLRYYHQLSYEEISSILSINYQSARTLLYRAIKKIRKEYKKNKGN